MASLNGRTNFRLSDYQRRIARIPRGCEKRRSCFLSPISDERHMHMGETWDCNSRRNSMLMSIRV